MKDAIISLKNVGCTYNIRKKCFKFEAYEALKNINMDIYKGETLGLIGRNGAGKSTLLKIIASILKPNSGRIVHCKKNISVSLLSLQLGFSPDLSGVDNAIIGALLLGYSKVEAMRHLDSIIEFSELGSRINDPIKTYSTGMVARLGFAVGMIMSPDVLLVDEALGVGDAAFREKSTKAMREKLGSDQTVVFVSHQAPTLRSVCTRLIWLESGCIKMAGDTDKILQAYYEDQIGLSKTI